MRQRAVKYLLSGNQYNDLLKNEDQHKSIELNQDDPEQNRKVNSFLDGLEREELKFKYCRLCEAILDEDASDEEQEHIQ